MRLQTRFILIGLWITLFVVATPIMVLYALGYKLDLSTQQITKTGSMVAISEPLRAQIYVNDHLQKTRTGKTLRFLLPGDYVFKISKEGYQAWTKRLNVKSGLVTWANQERDFVTLFFNQAKPTKQAQNYSSAIVNIQNNSAVVLNGTNVSTYNPERQNLNQEYILETAPTTQTFPNSSSAYYFWKDALYQKFSEAQLAGAQDMQSNGRYALLLTGGKLLVAHNGGITVQAEQVSGFHLDQEHVWYIQNNILKHVALNTGSQDELATLVYTPVTSKIIRGNQQIFLLLDDNVYALNDKVEEIYRGITYAYWDREYQRLVMANSNEALMFDPSTFKTELIIRSSSTITQPIINRRTGYMFFINENKIKAIELDGRDHRNVYTIIDQPATRFLIDEPGEIITTFTDTQFNTYQIR